jgi:CubicO group peptidase (beta-lactamase class C family)
MPAGLLGFSRVAKVPANQVWATSMAGEGMMTSRIPVFFVFWLLCTSTAQAEAPTLDPAEDASHFGDPDSILFWTPEQQVAGYRNIDSLYPTRRISAGDNTYILPRAEYDLGDVEFPHGQGVMTLDEYIVKKNVAGLLVIKGGKIVYERYELGNTEETLWMSFSVAKSVTSMLVGAALKDGYIASVNESVSDYLPRLKKSAYQQTTILNLLQMSSGVAWNEDYGDPEADINTVAWSTLQLYEHLRNKPRVSSPGEVFNYNTAETNLVGTLLRSAIGNNLSTYLSEKIWKPFGMEFDGYWELSEPGGGEFGGSSICATLRDFGRIGLFALQEGRLSDGSRILPEGWMQESTTPSKARDSYGYLWWLRDGEAYGASGIFGQDIHIVPGEELVIALHSSRAVASDDADWALQLALFGAVTSKLSR